MNDYIVKKEQKYYTRSINFIGYRKESVVTGSLPDYRL